MSREQIAALGPAAQSPTDQEATIKARIAVIVVEIVPLQTYLANDGDVAPLVGLGFFDALIDARNAAEQVPA